MPLSDANNSCRASLFGAPIPFGCRFVWRRPPSMTSIDAGKVGPRTTWVMAGRVLLHSGSRGRTGETPSAWRDASICNLEVGKALGRKPGNSNLPRQTVYRKSLDRNSSVTA